MAELPYAPFYFSDWLGDTKVRRMNYEERGMYFELLAHAWQDPIPKDMDDIAHILGVTPARLEKAWKKIGPCWISDGNGSLLNPRLEKERKKQAAKRQSGSAGGQASKPKANAKQSGSE